VLLAPKIVVCIFGPSLYCHHVACRFLASSAWRVHLVLISNSWGHCQTEKGQLQTYLFLLQKYQLHSQLVEVGIPH
jgi:hypothetical protein